MRQTMDFSDFSDLPETPALEMKTKIQTTNKK